MFLSVLTFSSCTKEKIIDDNSLTRNSVIENNILSFLGNQKINYGLDSTNNAKFDSLVKNIDIRRTQIVRVNDSAYFYIIPINNNYITLNSTNKNTFKGLILMTSSKKDIAQGFIVEIIPNKELLFDNDNINNIAKNIFNFNNTSFSGIISLITLNGKLIQEREFNNGRLLNTKSLKKVSQSQFKQPIDKKSPMSNCIDWYLITTVYYEDGSSDRSETYLYTTCSDECQSARIIDPVCGHRFTVNCGSGSPSTSSDVEVVEEFHTDEITSDNAEDNNVLSGKAPLINYQCYWTEVRSQMTGILTNVIAGNVVIANRYETYIDRYSRNITRILDPFNQSNFAMPLTVGTFYITWRCNVIGQWYYNDGSPNYSRVWEYNSAKVCF